jgi:hypothetical protein
MKYFATIQEQKQDINYGTDQSPEFETVKGGWLFESESEKEIKESLFTPGELIEFESKESGMKFLQSNCDPRFIEFAPKELLEKMTPEK